MYLLKTLKRGQHNLSKKNLGLERDFLYPNKITHEEEGKGESKLRYCPWIIIIAGKVHAWVTITHTSIGLKHARPTEKSERIPFKMWNPHI